MERRTLRFHDFDQVLSDADRLLAGYTRAGNWTLAQIATHLAIVLEMSLDGFPRYLPWPLTLLPRWFALGKILRHERFRRRVPAPNYLQPGNPADDQAGVDRLRAVIERWKHHTGPLKPSPIFGTLTHEQWREVHLWHCEHHLSFLHPTAKEPEASATDKA
jgi:hypothetical protein